MMENQRKICLKCKIEKSIDDFHNHKRRADGKAQYCKICNNKMMKPKTKAQQSRDVKKYALLHPEKVRASFKRYYNANKSKVMLQRKIYLDSEKGRNKTKKYYEQNRNKINEKRRRYKKNISPKSIVAKSVRDRFYKVVIAIKKGEKLLKTSDLIGCSFNNLKLHIEKQFCEGMTWQNHGNGENKWNIDHIIPLVKFDLSDLEQQKIAFHYTNLRPLWFIENIKRPRKNITLIAA